MIDMGRIGIEAALLDQPREAKTLNLGVEGAGAALLSLEDAYLNAHGKTDLEAVLIVLSCQRRPVAHSGRPE